LGRSGTKVLPRRREAGVAADAVALPVAVVWPRLTGAANVSLPRYKLSDAAVGLDGLGLVAQLVRAHA
jgi:hypothetical protein